MKRTPMPKSRGRVRPISEKRRSQLDERAACRATVIARAEGQCGAWSMPGVPHDHRTPLVGEGREEVHELRRGAARSASWLNPDWCILLCSAAHAWCTAEGYPEPARSLGLVESAFCDDPGESAARRARARKI